MEYSEVELCDGVTEEVIRECLSESFDEDASFKTLCQMMADLVQRIADCGEALCGESCAETNAFVFNNSEAVDIFQDVNSCGEDICTIKFSSRS